MLEYDVVVLADCRLVFADAKGGGTGEGVGEGVLAGGEGLGDFAAGSDCDVEDPDGRVGVLVEKKALVYGEIQEIAEVTSHDFWRKIGRKDGLKSVKGGIGNTTVRPRAGWSEAERQ